MSTESPPRFVSIERRGPVLLIGLNRPGKRNAFTRPMLAELAAAYALLDTDDDVRCGVLFAHGAHFTGGLDLAEVGPALSAGESLIPDGGRDPFRLEYSGAKPVVAAAQGWVMTLGIELLLAADIRVAARDSRFAQFEIRRGLYPFGGATIRFPAQAGWGNAMRWLLTGDEFDAEEALRIGLIQEVAVDAAAALDRAVAIATTIATKCAPLGIEAVLQTAQLALKGGPDAGIAQLRPHLTRLLASADWVEGGRSFAERRDATFVGR